MIRGKQVVPAERTASVLLGEQAQVIAIQRGFHLAPPRGPVVDQIGVIWGCPPATIWCRTMGVQENLTK